MRAARGVGCHARAERSPILLRRRIGAVMAPLAAVSLRLELAAALSGEARGERPLGRPATASGVWLRNARLICAAPDNAAPTEAAPPVLRRARATKPAFRRLPEANGSAGLAFNRWRANPSSGAAGGTTNPRANANLFKPGAASAGRSAGGPTKAPHAQNSARKSPKSHFVRLGAQIAPAQRQAGQQQQQTS